MFENYMKSLNKTPHTDKHGKYRRKIARLKQQIREYVHVSSRKNLSGFARYGLLILGKRSSFRRIRGNAGTAYYTQGRAEISAAKVVPIRTTNRGAGTSRCQRHLCTGRFAADGQ